MEAREFLIKYREYCEKQNGCGGTCPIFDQCLRFSPIHKLKDEYIEKIIKTIAPNELEEE